MHTNLNTFSREVTKHYDSYFEDYGLTTSYIELLLLVDESGSLSQKELSEKMNLAPSTITRFIRKLEKGGYIDKDKDGRLTKIIISEKDKGTVRKMKNLYRQANEDLKVKLGDKFVDTTNRLLKHGVDQFNEES